MKWDEFDNNVGLAFAADGQVQTDIECPICGKNVLWDSRVVLTSLPPQYSYWCTCGWSGTSYRKWGKE